MPWVECTIVFWANSCQGVATPASPPQEILYRFAPLSFGEGLGEGSGLSSYATYADQVEAKLCAFIEPRKMHLNRDDATAQRNTGLLQGKAPKGRDVGSHGLAGRM